ncbi:MAG: PIN domain nuclease [Actinomycetota bacterium]|nr:PIN domain nuclease [Actinomycetota bacterium]MDQ3410278.1 PIN domain nuclease [Actinomycetota bacterium]
MALVLDAGGLIAVDRRNQWVRGLLLVSQHQGVAVRTSSAVVAQVWRDGARQANLARLLGTVEVASLDPAAGRRVGELLARTASADVVDAHLALLVEPGDTVLTSDADDLADLLRTRGVRARLEEV